MKRNATIAAASAFAALSALAGCDQQPEQPPLGAAPSYTQERAAPATPAPGADPRRSAEMPAERPRNLGQTLNDAGISAKVKAALLASNDVEGAAIDVDTKAGRVTLKGKVTDPSQIDRAMQIARRVEGVRAVDNQLTAGGTS